MTERSSHGSKLTPMAYYLVTFLCLGLSHTPHSLVDLKAVVGGKLFDSQIQLCIMQDIVWNLVGDSWSTGTCTLGG